MKAPLMTCTRNVALTTVCLLTAAVAASEAPLKGRPAGMASKVKPALADCPACAMGMTAEKVFARLDVDGNETVTVEEFMWSPGMSDLAEARAAVGRIDTNDDGVLSWAELAKAYAERHARCPKVDPSKLGPEGRGNRTRFAMVFMMRNDKNGDGAVDKSEFRGSDARFDQMDENANGKLEPDELADLHASRMNDPKSMRERLASGDLPRRPPSKRPRGVGEPKGASKPQAEGRKCPADKVVIDGQDVANILTMLGAKREVGASDEQLRSYANHFDRSDTNRDGKHTRAEYVHEGGYMTPQARAGIFAATDNNADGIMTRVEYVLNRAITDEAKAIVQRTDTDKNGQVTRDEFVAGSPIKDKAFAMAVFDALDTSGDGMITVPEYLRVWGGWTRPNYKAQEAALAGRLAKLVNAGQPTVGPARGPPSVDRIFRFMDRDQDGKLTEEEFRGPANVFTSADKNKDGVVTRAEMEAMRSNAGKPSR